jgi:hypothetical protein
LFVLVIFKRFLCDAGDGLYGIFAIVLAHRIGSDLRVTNGKEETDLSRSRWKWKYGKWNGGRIRSRKWKTEGSTPSSIAE